jgi:hypothetical protein
MARKTAKRMKRVIKGGEPCSESFVGEFVKGLDSIRDDTVDELTNKINGLNDVSCIETIIQKINNRKSIDIALMLSTLTDNPNANTSSIDHRIELLEELRQTANDKRKEILEKGTTQSIYEGEGDLQKNYDNPLRGSQPQQTQPRLSLPMPASNSSFVNSGFVNTGFVNTNPLLKLRRNTNPGSVPGGKSRRKRRNSKNKKNRTRR